MPSETYITQEKVKLFISSGMSSEDLREIRHDIHQLLSNSPYVRGWLFEYEGASTYEAEIEYRMRVEDADVCVFIIDGRCEIPEGVQKELDEAARGSKRCFYYFYRINHEGPRMLREGLKGPEGAHYCEVDRLSEIPALIQKNVVEEIFFTYRIHARGYAAWDVGGANPSSMTMAQDVFVNRSSLSGYPTCEAILSRFLYNAGTEPEIPEGLDGAIATFLDVMLGNLPITGFRVSQMLGELRERLPETYYPTIELRWRAIQQFFLGDLNEAFELEKKAMERAKKANLPSWFTDDILIDLRNLEAETDRLQNIIYRQGSYQDEINDQNREIQLPLVDRITSDLLESIAAEELKKRVQSAYTITFGTPASKWVGMLVKLLAAVVHYGSLTHIRLFSKRMRLVASCLWRITGNRANLIAELKLAMVTSPAKDLRGFTNNNGSLYGEMTCNEADSAFSFAWNCASGCDKNETRVTAFAMLAPFLSEAEYNTAEGNAKRLCNELLAHEAIPPRELHRLLLSCYSISGSKWVIDVVIAALDKGPRTYWANEALSFLRDIDSERFRLTDEHAEELLRALGPHAVDEKADKGAIIDAIAGVWLLTARQAEWLSYFKEELNEYQKAMLSIRCGANDEAFVNQMLKQSLATIRKDNKTQGVGGMWAQNAIDYYIRIEVFLEKGEPQSPVFIEECAFACAETLLAQGQTERAKWGACLLLLSLVGHDSKLLNNNRLVTKLAAVNDNDFTELPVSLLGEHGRETVGVALVAIRSLFGLPRDEALRFALLPAYRSEPDEVANLCTLLGRLVRKPMWEVVSEDDISASVSFLLAMTSHESSLVRRNALAALTPLAMHPEFGRPVCAAFMRAFASSHPSSKHVILNALRDGGAFLPEEGSFILDAAESSSCFYVRRRVVGGELVS